MFFSFSLFFLVGFFFFKFYPRKILSLLALELLFLTSLFSIFFYKNLSSFNYFFFLVLLIFLVLDSVMGVSILVSIGRKSGCHSSWFF